MNIKDMAKIDRPREKMERYGIEKLGDEELLTILLGSGIRGTSVIEISRKIDKLLKNIKRHSITMESLVKIKGLGKSKAAQILSALELGRRVFDIPSETVLIPEKVFELCADIRASKREHFLVFYLTSRHALISREIISVGTLDSSLVHPREVFEPALRYGAACMIVAHNHPSGYADPSPEDIEITDRLRLAAEVMGVELLDHIILTRSGFLSLKQKKVLS